MLLCLLDWGQKAYDEMRVEMGNNLLRRQLTDKERCVMSLLFSSTTCSKEGINNWSVDKLAKLLPGSPVIFRWDGFFFINSCERKTKTKKEPVWILEERISGSILCQRRALLPTRCWGFFNKFLEGSFCSLFSFFYSRNLGDVSLLILSPLMSCEFFSQCVSVNDTNGNYTISYLSFCCLLFA